ncbi:MAG: Uncharacterized protein G01um10143_282 [Parcubacteria group bacterium Gr01-1014_3]|nr:MAG: Uncharacterized protein G01um10143_282 [Parcubacteria group bacterium Gr01-1014_3]
MKKLFFISLTFGLLISSNLALAQIKPTTLIVPIPIDGGVTQITNPGEYIRYIYLFGLSIGGLLGMAIIVYAAIERIVSAGNESKIKDANDRITQAAIGLVLLFGAYVILRAINPNLTNLTLPELQKVSLPTAKTKTSIGELLEKYETELEQAKLTAAQRDAELKTAVEKAKLANQQYEDNKNQENLINLLQNNVNASKALYWEIVANNDELNRQLAVIGAKADEAKLAGNKAEAERLNKEYEKLFAQYEQGRKDSQHQQLLWQSEEDKLKKALGQ